MHATAYQMSKNKKSPFSKSCGHVPVCLLALIPNLQIMVKNYHLHNVFEQQREIASKVTKLDKIIKVKGAEILVHIE